MMSMTSTRPRQDLRVAIVHDYLNQFGGAERVVGSLHKLFPDAPIFTSIVDQDRLWPTLRNADIRPSWMQNIPAVNKHFKKFLPLYPLSIESLDLRDFDLVISSSSAFAKGAITRKDALHLCYCYTPMRFAWDYDRYVEREQFSRPLRLMLPVVVNQLRRWDLRTANRPNKYVAISTVVKNRIKACYGLDSEVIFPPVEVDRFTPTTRLGDYFLVVSRLVPYKRIDLVIKAFNQTGLPLIIIGDGPDLPVLERMAHSNITFLGRQPDSVVTKYFSECKALIFPGEEDFGITPLEANAAGRPVIAYRAGGALDTVVEGKTGIFFNELSPSSLIDAVDRAIKTEWKTETLRSNADLFSEQVFLENFSSFVNRETDRHYSSPLKARF